MRVHTGDKPYKCSLCNKCFSRSGNLQLHKRCLHSNRRPYHCPYCGKLFKMNNELKCHVRIHTDAKPYLCRHCSDCFLTHYRLKAHLLKSHNEGKTFVSSSLLHVVNWSNIHFDVMKMWSRMFAVNVQSVSVQQLNCDFIVWFIQTTNSFVVVVVVNISNVKVML